MKLALYEETFIRSVEHITTIIIIITVPKSSKSSTSFPQSHCMCTTGPPHFLFITMILSYIHIHNWCLTLLVSLKSLEVGSSCFSSSSVLASESRWRSQIHSVIWHTNVLRSWTGCVLLLFAGLWALWSIEIMFSSCLYQVYNLES